MKTAFFDLDRTLIDVNSGHLWIKREYRLGWISTLQLAQASWWLLRYSLGWTDLEGAIRSAILGIKGQCEIDFQMRNDAFYHEEIKHRYRPEALMAVEYHRAQGDRLCLITTSSQYLSAHVIRDLGFDGGRFNRFEVKSDHFSGEPLGPLCFGEGKRHAAEDWLREVGGSLSDSVFYTDSFSDIALLEAVGTPIVVCPDRKLKAEAQRRGWPIESWSMSGG